MITSKTPPILWSFPPKIPHNPWLIFNILPTNLDHQLPIINIAAKPAANPRRNSNHFPPPITDIALKIKIMGPMIGQLFHMEQLIRDPQIRPIITPKTQKPAFI
ncbi:MAG: hypothetical protein JKY43_07875 [Phycisphaerales bacterium]|nr:hypothetical protein [Phycisphaerales bacterium]